MKKKKLLLIVLVGALVLNSTLLIVNYMLNSQLNEIKKEETPILEEDIIPFEDLLKITDLKNKDSLINIKTEGTETVIFFNLKSKKDIDYILKDIKSIGYGINNYELEQTDRKTTLKVRLSL